MPRPEKVQAVAEIKERIEGAQAVFLAEYAGLSVKDQQVLRRELRAAGAEFKVMKMSMARLAVAELEIDTLDELLLGPTGLTFADGDPAGAAKALKNFAKTHNVFVVKGGLLGFEFLTPEKISELAELDPREVLLAKLAGAMQAPMANFAGLLAALPRNTANVLSQLLEKKEAEEHVTGDSPQVTDQEDTLAEDGEPSSGSDQPSDASEPSDEEDPSPESSVETETTVEASKDAGDESNDQADEASQDDAAEE